MSGAVAGARLVPGPSHPFEWSLSETETEDLRWYLEDYLRAPYGANQDRGELVAASLAKWGMVAFDAVFGRLQLTRDAYLQVRRQGGPIEVVVRSASTRWLGLPWELLMDPGRPVPLVLDGVRMRRALPAGPAKTVAAEGKRLRVLMVIARPAGKRDVDYRMVARPLLARLETVRGEVDLVVLRPPTLDCLRQELASARAAGTPFQVVHFDGHGATGSRRRPGSGPTATPQDLPPEEGVLVFERAAGGQHPVPASQVADVLVEAQVPLVVLNACQSGASGEDLSSAVATELLHRGTPAVVAMAFNVYAVAAAEFMTAFYDRLFAGAEVADAVSAGRLRLARRKDRPSPKGPLPLEDWLVPVLYARHDVTFPQLRRDPTADSAGTSSDASPEQVQRRPAGGDLSDAGDPLAAVGEFVGRDGLFYELETAARVHQVVLLHGSAGTGKTELAKAFGRWWRDTGGVERPERVIWHSFEPGVASFGLTGVLNAVGIGLRGPEFAQLDDERRRAQVLALLHRYRLLLILDNFESVSTMAGPGGAAPLSETSHRELTDFLTAAGAGDSVILITSRSTEGWLGNLGRIEVVGLGREEADEFTDILLEPYPDAANRRGTPTFADLMTWLDGHPLSMRLVLPHLHTADAAAILAALRGTGESLLGADQHDRTVSLTASLDYSYRHLTSDEQQALVVLSLFHNAIDAAVLARLSITPESPAQFRDRSAEAWAGLLDRAANLGLLIAVDANMYTLHPALPAYLTVQWQRQHGDSYDGQRTATEHALVDAHARYAYELAHRLKTGDAPDAFAIIHVQRHTLGVMLSNALALTDYLAAGAIVMILMRYWDTRGLRAEARSWAEHILQVTTPADGSSPGPETPAGALWLAMRSYQASHQADAYELDPASHTLGQLHDLIAAQPESPARSADLAATHLQQGILSQRQGDPAAAEERYQKALALSERLGDHPCRADSYHQLGTIAQLRGDLAAAKGLYEEALAIRRRLRDHAGMAAAYHQLGTVAESARELDTAEDLYQQALDLSKRLGDQRRMAIHYHHLGVVAELRGQLSAAERWHLQSLHIAETLRDQPGMAASYHQLGIVTHQQDRLDLAERWYRKAVAIDTALDNQPGVATGYHQLGLVAQHRGEFDTAELWYHKALAIKLDLQDVPGVALSCGQLGLLAEARGDRPMAMTWMVRSVAAFDTFPHPLARPALDRLARLTADLGWDVLRACWTKVTRRTLPTAVVDYIKAVHDKGLAT